MRYINERTLVPPYSVGRNVTDDDWNRIFPNGCRRAGETEEEYRERKKPTEEEKK